MSTLNHKPFHFKQFSLFHHSSTMKVGTDAILLAIWCDVVDTSFILDIGTGSGIIALLLATRSKATIHAVELDNDSVIEARLNFKKYQNNQVILFHDDFNSFADSTKQKYDLIISNPPFFNDGLLPKSKSRKIARHTETLNYNQLCSGVSTILSASGRFCIVLPYNNAKVFIKIANNFSLYLYKQLIIYPKPNEQPNRVNLEFRFNKSSNINTKKITIRNSNGTHSSQYKNYVENYMLKI